MKKAIIGIVSKHYASYKNNRTDTYVRDEVKQAIFDNGAIGGTTYEIDNPEKHMKMLRQYVHNIKIDKTSKFYKIVNKEEIMVNSRHKRTIKDCPKLDKVGFCEDGYADVIEAKDKEFYIGVRFHPESLYKIDETMNNIFKSFISACKKKSER